MLYLEDYLEIIENLPIEMRDKFTEMREMDLQVSNAKDSLESQVEGFFKKCSTIPNLKQDWKEEQMAEIRAGYSKALDDADEKIQLTNQIYDLIERHLRKLDQEVNKFKLELEADHAGITEIIEKRSLDLEKNNLLHSNSSSRPEKRKYYAVSNYLSNQESPFEKLSNNNHNELLLDPNFMFGNTKINSSSPTPNPFEHLGSSGGNTAIAVAASRAIGATLEMPKGRRTASLKASYEAVSKTVDMKEILPYPRSDTSRTSSGEPNANAELIKSSSRQKKPTQKSLLLSQANYARQQHHQHSQVQHQSNILEAPMLANLSPSEGLLSSDGGLGLAIPQEDPAEPRYCLCNDVSYGEMVGCDNDDCPFEWFHYGCVGLQQAPRGKWYCPQCLNNMRRRSRK